MSLTTKDLIKAYNARGSNYKPRTKHIDENGRAKFVNHLILEESPYLLQHAHNPVNWYAFKDEVFKKAQTENKLIFISIGYTTCHWCHVMEEQSFDDIEVAQIMNKHFIAIKVDREIRTDVDATYMQVCQILNSSGGWPLNAITLPDGRALFASTYFDKIRFMRVLSQIQKFWHQERNKVMQQVEQIATVVKKSNTIIKTDINKTVINQAIETILSGFDKTNGGFGEAPKFPQETMLLLLIDEQKRNADTSKLDAINNTLSKMANGGFYDVVGGGFHRYSTDSNWLIPHFEKMLYNQAQLALVYTKAYEITNNNLYKYIATKTIDYVLREMKNHNNGFFSATDADSEGIEGTFFVWSITELSQIFVTKEFALFKNWFDLSAASNFDGKHIIRYKNINTISENDFKIIDKLLNKLYKTRLKRVPPLTDYKILLSWNALMVHSLLCAGEAFDNDKYIKAGLELNNYLHVNFNKNDKLYRTIINNKTTDQALCEDYAYLINAYLAVFDHTADNIWLKRIIKLKNKMNQQFWDNSQGGFNIGCYDKYLNSTHKDSYDGATPSTNGITYNSLVKLANRTTSQNSEEQQLLLSAFANNINQNPYHYQSFIIGLNNKLYGELAPVQYAYNGQIRIHTKKIKFHTIIINIKLKPSYYINSNTPNDNLIATKITNMDTKNWSFKKIIYPPAKLTQLKFSKSSIYIYKNNIDIFVELKKQSTTNNTPHLKLSFQACNDKSCLTPTAVTLKP